MKAVVSTVSEASVTVDGTVVGSVDGDRDGAGRGALLVLLGVGRDDNPDAAETMARKIAELRILPPVGEPWDAERDCSALDNGAEILVVSQFTLMGRTARGRRPSWSDAAPGVVAGPVVARITDALRTRGLSVESGEFGSFMHVASVNEGPFTVLIEI